MTFISYLPCRPKLNLYELRSNSFFGQQFLPTRFFTRLLKEDDNWNSCDKLQINHIRVYNFACVTSLIALFSDKFNSTQIMFYVSVSKTFWFTRTVGCKMPGCITFAVCELVCLLYHHVFARIKILMNKGQNTQLYHVGVDLMGILVTLFQVLNHVLVRIIFFIVNLTLWNSWSAVKTSV